MAMMELARNQELSFLVPEEEGKGVRRIAVKVALPFDANGEMLAAFRTWRNTNTGYNNQHDKANIQHHISLKACEALEIAN